MTATSHAASLACIVLPVGVQLSSRPQIVMVLYRSLAIQIMAIQLVMGLADVSRILMLFAALTI